MMMHYTHIHVYIQRYTYICVYVCVYIYESHTCVCVCVYIYMKQVFDGAVFAFIRYETWLYFLSFYIIMFCFILLNKILVTT